jgi:UDP-GlcNAc:undecaprenyl-phosphate GlcNAc-1-phosphate transferase
MVMLLLPIGIAFGVSFLLVPPLAWVARRVRLLDVPDGRRKTHSKPVPLIGGLAIFVAMCVALVASRVISSEIDDWCRTASIPLTGLFAAAAVLCVIGLADDRFALRGRHKLVGQALAVTILLLDSEPIQNLDLFGWDVALGPFAIPFTAFWLLGAINALNLIDGMDGMVGCVGTVIAAAVAMMALWSGHFAAALVALTLIAAVAGFLCFNLPPAKVYMGDCGSMLIGLFVGVLALHSALKGPTTVMLSVSIALLTIPILDTGAAILRRTLTGRSIYTTDRGHLHHCLQRSGLSRRRVLMLVSFLCLLTGLGALASLALQRQFLAAVAAFAVVGILVVTRLFGHAEMVLVKKRFAAAVVRVRYGHDKDRTHEVCVRLQGSADWQELWQTFTETAAQLQLSSMCLDVSVPNLHEDYHARWDRMHVAPESAQLWKVEIPLSFKGQSIGRLEIQGMRDHVPVFEKIEILGKIAEDVEQAVALMAEAHTRPDIMAQPAAAPRKISVPKLDAAQTA